MTANLLNGGVVKGTGSLARAHGNALRPHDDSRRLSSRHVHGLKRQYWTLSRLVCNGITFRSFPGTVRVQLIPYIFLDACGRQYLLLSQISNIYYLVRALHGDGVRHALHSAASIKYCRIRSKGQVSVAGRNDTYDSVREVI